ncbi:phospholipid transport system transporter-binding protein [Nicoletella semolina]|uniref:Phospholipid transport system transporter-binding protein n=1 Tax=Nicoletella semolina TaxID=271160 RepID=A0A4R2ND04_9PAST|nr:STAS domain-containing protein [Nicoletella semolina]MDH2924182.1 NTP binding protein (Contains STAS domain) [Nicoletella semolina]TCP18922.1 phospholipid transport system transporter-binding protein [Nicoletella semolina]
MKNQLQWRTQQNNESLIVELMGEFTRDTLLPLWNQRDSFLHPEANQHIYWDLKHLVKIDSAGFTLLTELLHHYQKRHSNCVINAPEKLKALADLFDLSDWFSQFIYCERKKNDGIENN